MTNSASAEKKKKAPPRRRWWFFGMLLFVCAGFACWLLAGFSIYFPSGQQREELQSARAAWQAQGIGDYRLGISTGAYRLWITVRNGEVELAEQDENSESAGIEKIKYEDSPVKTLGKDECPAMTFHFMPLYPYYLTVENLFDYAEQVNNEAKPPLVTTCWQNPTTQYTVKYNESFSYPETIWHLHCQERNIGMGLLCPGDWSDCGSLFHVMSFEALPEK